MATGAFVRACKAERDALLASYADPDGGTAVGQHLRAAGLSDEQRREVFAALDLALTDAFYALLMGLAGAGSLGDTQQHYRLADERGRPIAPNGDADLEATAFELFQDED